MQCTRVAKCLYYLWTVVFHFSCNPRAACPRLKTPIRLLNSFSSTLLVTRSLSSVDHKKSAIVNLIQWENRPSLSRPKLAAPGHVVRRACFWDRSWTRPRSPFALQIVRAETFHTKHWKEMQHCRRLIANRSQREGPRCTARSRHQNTMSTPKDWWLSPGDLMVLAGFSLNYKLGVRFLEETFLLADTSMVMILGMPFLPLSDAEIGFVESLFGGVTQYRGHAFWPPPWELSLLIEENLRPPHLIEKTKGWGYTSYCLQPAD